MILFSVASIYLTMVALSSTVAADEAALSDTAMLRRGPSNHQNSRMLFESCPDHHTATDCSWKGTAPMCDPECADDEIILKQEKKGCWLGYKIQCCKCTPDTSGVSPNPPAQPTLKPGLHLSDSYMTWSEADAYCKGRNQALVSVRSQNQWDDVLALTTQVTCNGNCGGRPSNCPWFWLGGFKHASASPGWRWEDPFSGDAFDQYEPSFFEVDGSSSGQSKLAGWGTPTSQCYSDAKGNGWHDAPEGWKMRAVCMDDPNDCPDRSCYGWD